MVSLNPASFMKNKWDSWDCHLVILQLTVHCRKAWKYKRRNMHRIHLDVRIINSTADLKNALVWGITSECLSHKLREQKTHRAQGFLKAHLVEMSGTEGGTTTLKGQIDDVARLRFAQNGWHRSQISHLANDACGIQSKRQRVCWRRLRRCWRMSGEIRRGSAPELNWCAVWHSFSIKFRYQTLPVHVCKSCFSVEGIISDALVTNTNTCSFGSLSFTFIRQK